MIISKEAFVDLQEKYNKVKKLIEEDSKLDPETEPFLSKYAARSILISMNANLENLLRSYIEDTPEHIKLIGMLGTTQLTLGVISIDTEELSVGEKHLMKCKEIIDKYKDRQEIAFVYLNMYNQLGILWSKREPEKALKYLQDAEAFYYSFKESNLIPIEPSDLFIHNIEEYSEGSSEKFEKLYTHTLYYLAQIYGVLGNALKTSMYCHSTLKRQLESKDYDPIDWALNSATLSQYFMEKNGFKQARHHLSASSYILDKYMQELNAVHEHNDEHDAKMETFKHRSADVARCWAKYGLLLLTSSKERLLQHTDDIEVHCSASTDLAQSTLAELSEINRSDLQDLFFPTLNISNYENQITDQFILTLQDAHKVFNNIQMWLNKAHSYYMLDTLASDYIEIVQDKSQMYENLVFFDDSVENQAKLYKRAADLLDTVLKQINPTYYMQYCRQMWFKLGIIYSNIVDIKLDKLREVETRPTPHALSKVNMLVDKSIQNFQLFIDSFKNANKEITVDENVQKPYLEAFFHMGALYGKYITLDKTMQIKNSSASLNAYKEIVDYCDKHPKASEAISTEFKMLQEMIQLLPLKIMKLENEMKQLKV